MLAQWQTSGAATGVGPFDPALVPVTAIPARHHGDARTSTAPLVHARGRATALGENGDGVRGYKRQWAGDTIFIYIYIILKRQWAGDTSRSGTLCFFGSGCSTR